MTISAVSVSRVFFTAFFPSFVFRHALTNPRDVEGRGGERASNSSPSLTSAVYPFIWDDKECLHLLTG